MIRRLNLELPVITIVKYCIYCLQKCRGQLYVYCAPIILDYEQNKGANGVAMIFIYLYIFHKLSNDLYIFQ